MITVYKINLEEGEVEPVKCEIPGYPNKDENGAVMYTNTHFDTKAAAYRALLTNIEAWIAQDKATCEEIEKKVEAYQQNIRRNKQLIQKIKRKLK